MSWPSLTSASSAGRSRPAPAARPSGPPEPGAGPRRVSGAAAPPSWACPLHQRLHHHQGIDIAPLPVAKRPRQSADDLKAAAQPAGSADKGGCRSPAGGSARPRHSPCWRHGRREPGCWASASLLAGSWGKVSPARNTGSSSGHSAGQSATS